MLPVLLLALFSAAVAQPDPGALSNAWREAAAAHTAQRRLALQPTVRDFQEIASKGTFTRVSAGDEGGAVLGGTWVDVPVEQAWLVLADNLHRNMSEGAGTRTLLPGTTTLRRTVHFLLPLPWPVHDRQWVIRTTANGPLWDASGGSMTEFTWNLADPSLAPGADPDALWIEDYRGGWTLVEADGGTLVLLSAEMDLGGVIPQDFSTRFAVPRIRKVIETFAAYAQDMPRHYGSGHEALPDPAGRTIPPGSLDARVSRADGGE